MSKLRNKLLLTFGIVFVLAWIGVGSYVVSSKLYANDKTNIEKESLISPNKDKKNDNNSTSNNTSNDINNTISVSNESNASISSNTDSNSNKTQNNNNSSNSKTINNTDISGDSKENIASAQSKVSQTQTNLPKQEVENTQPQTDTTKTSSRTGTQLQPTTPKLNNQNATMTQPVYVPSAKEIQSTRDRKESLENALKDLEKQLTDATSKKEFDEQKASGRPDNNDINAVNRIQYQINADKKELDYNNKWLAEYDK